MLVDASDSVVGVAEELVNVEVVFTCVSDTTVSDWRRGSVAKVFVEILIFKSDDPPIDVTLG